MTDKQISTAVTGNKNLFITGPAGTGKTFLLNKIIEEETKKGKSLLLCAPTGIAAINIGGETLHKVFHIPVPAFEAPSFAKNKKGAITTAQLKIIAAADVLIIDEISMCRNDVFSFVIKVLRKAEKLKGSKIRIIVCGDFNQLPPVVKKSEEKLFKKFGFHISGYPFTTKEWETCKFKVIELKDVKRQENIEFIENLNNIRAGINIKEAITYFNTFVNKKINEENAIYVCGTNVKANEINKEYLDSISGDLKVLQAEKNGRGTVGIVEDILLVKENAKIIFTTNDVQGKYKNGTFGVIKRVFDDYVIVEIDGKDIFVKPYEYKIYNYSVNKNALVKKEIGCAIQYPFKIGKAITIHKSQGQTFDNVILSPEIFANGQLYVALSRVRTPEGLSLLSEINENNIISNSIVEDFIKNGYVFKDIPKKPVAKKSTTTKKKTNIKKGPTKRVAKKRTAKNTTEKSNSSIKKSNKRSVTTKKSTYKK